MARKIAVLTVLLVALAGCATQLRTAPRPATACDGALVSGRLATSTQSGLAIVVGNGSVVEVRWPFGYSARRGVSGVELLDEEGAVVAHEGDFVEMGGGVGADKVWDACAGSIKVVQPQG